MEPIDTSILSKLIYGRVEPHIYAFTTETVPNYLKVGDTYRPVEVRLSEWKKHYPNLIYKISQVAKVNDNTFFRDYEVHKYLEFNGFKRLCQEDIPQSVYYSKEFFKNVSTDDVKSAIIDINKDFKERGGRYQFFELQNSRVPITHHYLRTETYKPRPNQKNTITNFISAINKNRNNLLMYAVMRFGKSFTAMSCANEISAKVVVIVSAKSDVKEEWKKTVESHVDFGSYVFADRDDLDRDYTFISNVLSQNKRVALFLTLQDLQGDLLKERHKELFKTNIDLLIIDETHFGARAVEYGKVLLKRGLTKQEIKSMTEDEPHAVSYDEVESTVKFLNAKYRIHLSGTPYRILMGDEFSKDDIIAFYQFTDIVNDQQAWDDANLNNDNVREWDNPYYGFPQMIRFAFNPSKLVQERLSEISKSGKSFAFSVLLRPLSLERDESENYKHFKYESEVEDLLEVIDGSKEDENVLGFLNYQRIKDGKMCRHIVCVLPYCASCDALEYLIKRNNSRYINLSDYKVLNISGVGENVIKSNSQVQEIIAKYDSSGLKTITLTVNRMLTGSTVPQWDTMIYLKDTASPQEYDQSTFRLQNPYIKTYKTASGEVIKYNMKPQTLLVDFDPNRMFLMQELKSQIYNANVDKKGNSKLTERLQRELEISPIIVLNSNKIERVKPVNILDVVRAYSRNRSIMDEALDIPLDMSLMNNDFIKDFISSLEPIDSHTGIKTKASEGEGADPDWDFEPDDPQDGSTPANTSPDPENSADSSKETEDLDKKLATYYSEILIFSFLTNDVVKSLEDVINIIPVSEDNRRIFSNVGLNMKVLKYILKFSNPQVLSKLDYKIQNINDLSSDISLSPIERAQSALRKFDRLSDSEIITPIELAEKVTQLLPEDVNNGNILDIASKQGEFAIALYKRFGKKIQSNLYAVPTSGVTYELTRKIFSFLEIPVNNVFSEFTSYDLISDKNQQIIKKLQNMRFKAIVGNPPYQDKGGSGGNNDAPIYQCFSNISTQLCPDYISLIIKAAWFAAGRENLLADFRKYMLNSGHIQKLVVYSDSSMLFTKDVEIKGGCCYYLENKNYTGDCDYTLIEKDKRISVKRKLNTFNILIREPHLSDIVEKVYKQIEQSKTQTVDSIISSDTPFGIPSNPKSSKKTPFPVYSSTSEEHNILLYHIEKGKRKIEYVSRKNLKKNSQDIDKIKVFVTGSGGSGNDKKVMGCPEYAPAGSVCSQSYLYASFDSEIEAKNFIKYIYTKFFRLLVSALKITQSAPSKVYRYVPMQDFTENSDINWNLSIDEINRQLLDKYGLVSEIAYIDDHIVNL